jgi:hypothetical protein
MKHLLKILKDRQSRHRIEWPTVGVLIGIVGFWACIIICLMMTCSCASQKETHEHQTHVVNADTLASEAKHDGHHHQTTQNLDSLVTASVWAAMAEFVAQEQQKETTTETITTWVDSLGREMRQEQRTTQREISKQEQQRWQQTEERWQNELHRTLSQMDSAWSDRMSEIEIHLRDSLAKQFDQQKQTNMDGGPTWWQKTWAWLRGILVGIVIAAVIIFIRHKNMFFR